jgi:hypothetical protein
VSAIGGVKAIAIASRPQFGQVAAVDDRSEQLIAGATMPAATTQSDGRRPRCDRGTPRAVGALAGASLLAFGTVSPAAATTIFEATYAISVAGLMIGAAEAKSRFTDTHYTAIIRGNTSGISRLVSDARALLLGEGRIAGDRLLPASYDLETSEGEFETHVRMKMRAGAVTELLVIPRLSRHPDRIPLDLEHKRNVVDPVAAFLVVADTPGIGDGSRICRRTIKVFDGWQRYDVQLTYKQIREVDGSGDAYDGRVVVCTARYVPVAGHRMSLEATRYMADNKRLEVWYAPVSDRRLVVPYRILIGTAYGDLVIVATRFVATGGNAKPAVGN